MIRKNKVTTIMGRIEIIKKINGTEINTTIDDISNHKI
jgi:hypothetical protein